VIFSSHSQRQPGAEIDHHLGRWRCKKWILDKTLGDRSYGARPLRRALQRYIEDPLRKRDRRLIMDGLPPGGLHHDISSHRSVSNATEEKTDGILLYSA